MSIESSGNSSFKLSYQDIGPRDSLKTPIVVIHGGPGLTSHYLQKPLEPLSADRRVVFYDQRGYQEPIEKINVLSMKLAYLVDDVETLRTSLNLGKMTLLAHSWGAIIAIKYAIQNPLNVDQLILVSPLPPSSKDFSVIKSYFAHQNQENESHEGDYRALFAPYFHTPKDVERLDLGMTPSMMESAKKIKGIIQKNVLEKGFDFYSEWRSLSIPTLITYGVDDPLWRPIGKSLKKNMPGAVYEPIERCGHFPFIEAPARFFSILSDA